MTFHLSETLITLNPFHYLQKKTEKQLEFQITSGNKENVFDIRSSHNSTILDGNGDELLIDDSKNILVNSTHAKIKNLVLISQGEFDM